jgi:predicted CopG family antitoxin
MAVKTITIDLEAYEALRRRKRKGQSFSEVIKEHFGRAATGRDLKETLRSLRLDASTLDALEELIAKRSAESATAAEL